MSESKEPPSSALSEVMNQWTKACLEHREVEEAQLQNDSRTFFRYLSRSTKVVTDLNVTLETRSSHEEALARLIQDLGPAFSKDHYQSWLRALHVLVGAIEGCKETQLSNTISQLLGKFLLSHCGPIDDDDYVEDYDSMIRNIAIVGLTALSSIPGSGKDNGEVLEAILMRLEFAREGINFRCALPDNSRDSENAFSYGFDNGGAIDIREGLATLPRSKRSLCFALMGAAVRGVSAITNRMDKMLEDSALSSLQNELITFAKFASNCLHGESDPRCLLEVLTILHEMQVAFEPYFVKSARNDLVFPHEDVFDAVAPYYPIQFTPPPNNIHGITREGLHAALVAVLSYTKLDANALENKRPTMLSLSVGLFIEQLLPMDGEEEISTIDKMEAIESISSLVLPKEGNSSCDMLEAPTLRNLWAAIKRTHDESSLGISQEGDHGKNCKYLADQCRTLVSKLALQFELSSNKALWEVFISEPLQKQSQKLKTSPNQSKLLLAYIACLTASGGPRTLRFCLQVGLESLLDYLGAYNDDSEDTAAATHGIGAFLSSCQVAMERARKEGIVLHPHPLEKYAAKTCNVLLDAFESDLVSLSIKMGAVRALEFLLLTTLEQQLEANQLERLCSSIRRMIGTLQESDENIDLQNACCLTLGNIVGSVLENSDKAQSSLLVSQSMNDMIKNESYRTLLEIATTPSTSLALQQYGRKALSFSCGCGAKASEEIVSSLLKSLCDSIEEDKTKDSCLIYAKSLSYIFENAGDLPIKAYHNNDLSAEMLKKLRRIRPKGEAVVRENLVNLITLPNTTGEKKALYDEIDSFVIHLLPAYEKELTKGILKKLTKEVSDIIPPLSDMDNINLFIRLPILGVALASLQSIDFRRDDDFGMETDDTSLYDDCVSMLPGLTEYVLNNENDERARSGAASCIFVILSLGTLDMTGCPIVPLIKDNINPNALLAHDDVSVRNSLNMMALMGSAAARRGKSSSNTADKIATYLLELACYGIATLPFALDETQRIVLSSVDTSDTSLGLAREAASAYGSILSVDMKSLMKQRLTHGFLKHMKTIFEEKFDQTKSGPRISSPNGGLLAMICHFICDTNLEKIDKMTMHQIASIAVDGLCSSDLFDPNGTYSPTKSLSKNLVLVAIIKLLSIIPETVSNGFLLTLVTGLLQAYAVSDPSREVSSKLLALQGLEAMSRLEGTKKAMTTIQPAVVSVLAAAVNHPSGLLRQAAVDARNAWYLVV